MSLAGCQIDLIDVNFRLQKSFEIFDTNSADKIKSQNYKGVKVTCLMPNRVEADVKSFKEKQKQKFRRMSYLLHATIISFFLYFLLCFHIFLTFWVTLIIGWCVSCLSYLVQCVIKKPKAASFKPPILFSMYRSSSSPLLLFFHSQFVKSHDG